MPRSSAGLKRPEGEALLHADLNSLRLLLGRERESDPGVGDLAVPAVMRHR